MTHVGHMTQPEPRSQVTQVETGADLLAAIPVSLGYWPTDSVLVVLCQGPRVELTIRIDADWFLVASEAVARQVEVAVKQLPDARCYLLGYFSDRALIEVSLAQLIDLLPVEVVDVLITDDERWWSLMCGDGCCPPHGRPFDRNTQRVTAQAVFDGIDVGLRREDLVAVVAGPTPSGEREQEFERARATVRAQPVPERIEMLETATRSGDGYDGGLIAALLADDEVAAWVLDTFEPKNADKRLGWLSAAVAACPPNHAVPAVGLLGTAAWLAGGGPILTAAAQRLEQLDPDHPLARLLNRLITGVVPPYLWQRVS